MFKLNREGKDWVIIYTEEHLKEDISYMGEKLLPTVRRLNKALSEDELFSIMELNMADTANLLSILSEIEICSSWNMFDKRETKDIISSLVNMLCSQQVYDKNGLEISKW